MWQVLSDPRQRRFFSSSLLRDLFTLNLAGTPSEQAPDGHRSAAGSSETADMFQDGVISSVPRADVARGSASSGAAQNAARVGESRQEVALEEGELEEGEALSDSDGSDADAQPNQQRQRQRTAQQRNGRASAAASVCAPAQEDGEVAAHEAAMVESLKEPQSQSKKERGVLEARWCCRHRAVLTARTRVQSLPICRRHAHCA